MFCIIVTKPITVVVKQCLLFGLRLAVEQCLSVDLNILFFVLLFNDNYEDVLLEHMLCFGKPCFGIPSNDSMLIKMLSFLFPCVLFYMCSLVPDLEVCYLLDLEYVIC